MPVMARACDAPCNPQPELCSMSSYGTATTLHEEALLVVRSTPSATLQRLRRLAELFNAYSDGDGFPSPRCECLLEGDSGPC